MDVTKSNFKEVLPKVQEAIDNSTFITIDCELTGLNVTHNINAFDTPAQYYDKVRKNCRDFLVIQYGLSIFRYDEEKDVFKQQSYNFYIFRKPVDRNIPDQRFLCQTSSIDFLISQGFDFNKLFKEGISYLNSYEEDKLKNALEERKNNKGASKQPQTRDIIPIPDNLEDFIKNVVNTLNEFVDSDEVEVQLPKCNAFARRLIYQTAGEKYGDRITLESRQVERDRIIFACKVRTKEEVEELEKKRYEADLEAFDDYIGFSKVLKMIRLSEKLVIGHNMCLDILHTIDKFITPLPADYQEFKDCTSALFPKIIDTKYMAGFDPFKDLIPSTVLKNVLDTVSVSPFEMPKIEIEDGTEGYQINDNKEHEAGYDAFITGLSFISMWKYLGTLDGKSAKDTFKDFKLLRNVINRIHIMNLADNQYINLQGNDLNPSRDHVFYLTFPKEWKYHNVTELFSPFGAIYISWIDETSAYVGLNKKDQAAVALSTLSQSDVYSIMTFNSHKALLDKGLPVKSPAIGQRRRKSGETSYCSMKRRKTDSLDGCNLNVSTNSVEPIIEDEEEIKDEPWETVTKKGKRKLARTFKESKTWD